MKRTIITAVSFLALATWITGCTKLDETPYSAIFNTNFYKSATDAQTALVAAYDPLATMYRGPATIMASDFSADQSYPRIVVGRNTLTTFSYDANYTQQKTNSRLYEAPQQIWTSCYQGIERTNLIFEKIPAIGMNEARKSTIIGNAYFLRAFYFWTLAKNFKDVPIKLTSTTGTVNAFTPKSPMSEVYKQIYADLDQAIINLAPYSGSTVQGEASKEAALALYAKAALYNEDWPTAKAKAVLVIKSRVYDLLPNVLDVYDIKKEDAARLENIWAFESESIAVARYQFLTSLVAPPKGPSPTYGPVGNGSMFAYQAFFDSFDPLDKRRLLLDTSYVTTDGQKITQKNISPITPQAVIIKKYCDPNPGVAGYSGSNIPILRMADVYLIAAEAEARLNGATQDAYDFLLPVRERAGLDNVPADLSQTDFINAVLQERSWEFFGEGDRWYDLTRTNTFLTVIPKAVNNVFPIRTPLARNRYFPIPLDEVQANPQLDQNPDWK